MNFPTTDSTPYRSDYLYLQPGLSSEHSCKVRYSCFFEFFLERDLRSVDNRLRMLSHAAWVRPSVYREEAKPKPKPKPVAEPGNNPRGQSRSEKKSVNSNMLRAGGLQQCNSSQTATFVRPMVRSTLTIWIWWSVPLHRVNGNLFQAL